MANQGVTVAFGAMGPVRLLDRGAQGSIYEAKNVTLTGGGSAVYKEYLPQTLATIDAGKLAEMAEFLFALPADVRAWVVARAAWPLRVVEKSGRVTGFLMPRVPNEFAVQLQMPSGLVATTLAQAQHLLNKPSWLAARGLKVSRKQQFAFLWDVADTLTFFHEHRVHVGDFSAKNLLFRMEGDPRCFFIDCDAMEMNGSSVSRQLETPAWSVPSPTERRATKESDSYKFGLLVVRLLSGDQTLVDPSQMPAVQKSVKDLAQRSLLVNPRRRPAISDWLEPLSLATSRASDAIVRQESESASASQRVIARKRNLLPAHPNRPPAAAAAAQFHPRTVTRTAVRFAGMASVAVMAIGQLLWTMAKASPLAIRKIAEGNYLANLRRPGKRLMWAASALTATIGALVLISFLRGPSTNAAGFDGSTWNEYRSERAQTPIPNSVGGHLTWAAQAWLAYGPGRAGGVVGPVRRRPGFRKNGKWHHTVERETFQGSTWIAWPRKHTDNMIPHRWLGTEFPTGAWNAYRTEHHRSAIPIGMATHQSWEARTWLTYGPEYLGGAVSAPRRFITAHPFVTQRFQGGLFVGWPRSGKLVIRHRVWLG